MYCNISIISIMLEFCMTMIATRYHMHAQRVTSKGIVKLYYISMVVEAQKKSSNDHERFHQSKSEHNFSLNCILENKKKAHNLNFA